MIRKICLATNYNLYESKRYFCRKLGEALRRKDVEVLILDSYGKNIELFFSQILEFQPDLGCSFNSALPYEEGHFFWDKLCLPYLSLVVDPIFYYQNLTTSPYSMISCVDRTDRDWMLSKGFENIFFLPHAVDKELRPYFKTKRPYDVVLVGSSYDPDTVQEMWKKKFDADVCLALEEAIEIGFSDQITPFWEAASLALKRHHIESAKIPFEEFVYFVDYYMRGKDRLELIKSVKDAEVHVFGDPCGSPDFFLKGWEKYLTGQPNVVLHKGVSFEESFEIFKRSKICLNSVPSFKNGSHERIFISLACGCLPVTTDNLYIRENFVDGQELVLYQFHKREEVNEKINDFLSQEVIRESAVAKGREKVMLNHTWDKRAETILEALPEMMNHLKI